MGVSKISTYFLIVGLLLANLAEARSGSKQIRRRVGSGVVFPAFTDAILQNPSYLATEKARALQLTYEPPGTNTANTHDAEFAIASASDGFGWGLNYHTTLNTQARPNHGLAIACGFGAKIFSLGIGLDATNIDQGFTPDIDIALRGKDNLVFYQAVFNTLNAQSQLDLGIGLSDEKIYSVELDINMPSFDQIQNPNAAYTVGLGLSILQPKFSIAAHTAYSTENGEFTHRFTLSVRPLEFMHVISEVSYPLRYRLGLMFAF